jgi:hypothetical protein
MIAEYLFWPDGYRVAMRGFLVMIVITLGLLRMLKTWV